MSFVDFDKIKPKRKLKKRAGYHHKIKPQPKPEEKVAGYLPAFWEIKFLAEKEIMMTPKSNYKSYWDVDRATLEETSAIFKRLFNKYPQYKISVELDLSEICYRIRLT